MKRFKLDQAARLFASGLISFGCAKIARGESYSILDLGVLSTHYFGNFGTVNGINDHGEIVGTIGFDASISGNDYYGFRTSSVRPINLATDNIGQAGFSTIPTGINNFGQVVGKAFKAGTYGDNWYSFRTASDSKINPATDSLYMPNYSITATGINDAGQVIGNAWNVQEYLAFLTAPNSQVNQANILSQNIESNAVGINNLGQVVGTFYTGTGSDRKDFAFRTGPNGEISGKLADNLGTSGGKSISPYAINDVGQVVGSSYLPNGYIHAFRTSPNTAINPATDDLGSLGLFSYARAINSRGIVVGDSQLNDGYGRAFIYKNSSSGMQDLNVLANASKQNWTLINATGINSQGQIVGIGVRNGDNQTRGFVLTPVPDKAPIISTPPGTHVFGDFDPNKKMTVVITHGFEPGVPTGVLPLWAIDMQVAILKKAPNINVLIWEWDGAYRSNILELPFAEAATVNAGAALGNYLKQLSGTTTGENFHLIGHSLGTHVDAYAANILGNSVSQVTILDRPFGSVAIENLFEQNLFVNSLGKVGWVDNYHGLISSGSFGSDLKGSFYNQTLPGNHEDIHDWYTSTVRSNSEGFFWSVEGGGSNQRPPLNGLEPLPAKFDSTPAFGFDTPNWFNSIESKFNGSSANLRFKPLNQINGLLLRQSDVAIPEPGLLWSDITIPSNTQFIQFEMLWKNPGTGDYLTVQFGDRIVTQFSASSFDADVLSSSGLIPIFDFAGQTDQLLFSLNSGGSYGGELTIQNLVFVNQVPEPSIVCVLIFAMPILLGRKKRVFA